MNNDLRPARRPFRGTLVLATIVAIAGAASSPAAQAPLPYRQTVVVTAAAAPIELDRATRTLTVITRAELETLPVHTVADVLRLIPSVDVRARGERGVQTDFAVRGAHFGQMLVLVDGVRLNDAQSGHHNGDIPVPLDAIERIEVLLGPGSSVFGADAFGGAVNIITRRGESPTSLAARGGSFGLAGAEGSTAFAGGGMRQTVSASAERSSGFMYDRDFASVTAHTRAELGSRSSLSLSFLRKEFGAHNFYGGNAPSREWTNQTLVAGEHRFPDAGAWTFTAAASYRTHGDRFLFNQELPQLSDNRHRTHATLAGVTGSRAFASDALLTVGVEGGGDWIRSTNLGDHNVGRVSAFGEWRQQVGSRTHVEGGVRVDRYTEFGTAVSPSAGVGFWATPGVRLRASAGRAFRIPTFTERFYSDPANLARAEVGPETAWSGEAGADLFAGARWMFTATVFTRIEDDVIDWLRPSTAERWRTYNIRDVDTQGIELGVRRTFGQAAFVQANYTGLSVDAAAVDQLSKYVLDYASRSFAAAASLPLPGRYHVAPRLEYRRRVRSAGTADYVLLDMRVGHRIGRVFDLFVEGTNLFDERYEEVAGVWMPGASMSVSLAMRVP